MKNLHSRRYNHRVVGGTRKAISRARIFMLLGVVSDTHGDIARTRAAVQMLDSLRVEAVLHCGDIGTPEIVAMFAPWPTHFVFGNCDYDHKTLARAIEKAGQICHGNFGELLLEGVRIA